MSGINFASPLSDEERQRFEDETYDDDDEIYEGQEQVDIESVISSGSVNDPSQELVEDVSTPSSSGLKSKLPIIIAGAVILLAFIVGIIFFMQPKESAPEQSSSSSSEAASTSAAATVPDESSSSSAAAVPLDAAIIGFWEFDSAELDEQGLTNLDDDKKKEAETGIVTIQQMYETVGMYAQFDDDGTFRLRQNVGTDYDYTMRGTWRQDENGYLMTYEGLADDEGNNLTAHATFKDDGKLRILSDTEVTDDVKCVLVFRAAQGSIDTVQAKEVPEGIQYKPDVFVVKAGDDWVVDINPATDAQTPESYVVVLDAKKASGFDATYKYFVAEQLDDYGAGMAMVIDSAMTPTDSDKIAVNDDEYGDGYIVLTGKPVTNLSDIALSINISSSAGESVNA